MDVVVDIDILSTFAKVNKLRLLPKLFSKLCIDLPKCEYGN